MTAAAFILCTVDSLDPENNFARARHRSNSRVYADPQLL